MQREQESIIHWILIVFYEYHFCQNPITILTKIAECNIILSLWFDQSCVVTDLVSISILRGLHYGFCAFSGILAGLNCQLFFWRPFLYLSLKSSFKGFPATLLSPILRLEKTRHKRRLKINAPLSMKPPTTISFE